MGFSGMTTWRNRNASVFAELAELASTKKNLRISNFGPGVMHSCFDSLIPSGEKSSFKKLRWAWWRIARLAESFVRRFSSSGKSFITFEPFEIAKAMEAKTSDFHITVCDKRKELEDALRNSPEYEEYAKKISFRQANAEEQQPKADLIVALNVLVYANRGRVLSSLASALQRGGILVTNHLTDAELLEHGLALHKKFEDSAIYIKPLSAAHATVLKSFHT